MSVHLSTPTPFDPAPPASLRAVDAALCRAALYTALALGFRPPTEETVRRLAERQGLGALTDVARALECCGAMTGVAALVVDLAVPGIDLAQLSASHRRLFGHTARGEVPAYETEYGNEALFQQPQELSDIAGFMVAFGLALRDDVRERIDHVTCECEFLSFLAYKEAYAIEIADAEMLAATRGADALFLRDHLGKFAAAFARRVERADRGGFYGRLAKLLAAFVSRDCERQGVATGPEGLGLRPDPSQVAAPMGCDGGCNVGDSQ